MSTATLPEGWRGRLVAFENASTNPGRGWCLDAHDLAVSKLVAWREKDRAFVRALIEAGLISVDLVCERAATLPTSPVVKRRIVQPARPGPQSFGDPP